jgi:hypothetical protein
MPQISADARDFGTVHPSTETFWPKGKENANEAGEIKKMILLRTCQWNPKKNKSIFVNMEIK